MPTLQRINYYLELNYCYDDAYQLAYIEMWNKKKEKK